MSSDDGRDSLKRVHKGLVQGDISVICRLDVINPQYVYYECFNEKGLKYDGCIEGQGKKIERGLDFPSQQIDSIRQGNKAPEPATTA